LTFSLYRFLYDFVTFPNGVFSGTIISQIVKAKGHELVRKTAEYQLLLGALALPGCVIGALVVNRLGRRNLMIAGFAGYLVIGLVVGCAYNQRPSSFLSFFSCSVSSLPFSRLATSVFPPPL
jgi:MFS family permease